MCGITDWLVANDVMKLTVCSAACWKIYHFRLFYDQSQSGEQISYRVRTAEGLYVVKRRKFQLNFFQPVPVNSNFLSHRIARFSKQTLLDDI